MRRVLIQHVWHAGSLTYIWKKNYGPRRQLLLLLVQMRLCSQENTSTRRGISWLRLHWRTETSCWTEADYNVSKLTNLKILLSAASSRFRVPMGLRERLSFTTIRSRLQAREWTIFASMKRHCRITRVPTRAPNWI